MFRDDHAAGGDEDAGPGGRRLFEANGHGQGIDFFNLHIPVSPIVVAAVAGSEAYSQLNTTSSAVNGRPSCHSTPFLSFQVTDVPSAATPPFSISGIWTASTGTRSPSGSHAASSS